MLKQNNEVFTSEQECKELFKQIFLEKGLSNDNAILSAKIFTEGCKVAAPASGFQRMAFSHIVKEDDLNAIEGWETLLIGIIACVTGGMSLGIGVAIVLPILKIAHICLLKSAKVTPEQCIILSHLTKERDGITKNELLKLVNQTAKKSFTLKSLEQDISALQHFPKRDGTEGDFIRVYQGKIYPNGI